MSDDEKNPLLLPHQSINDDDLQAKVDTEPRHPRLRWGHYLMGPCLTLHLLSFMYTNQVIGQYIYYYFAKHYYPGSPILHDQGGSECHINKTSLAYTQRTHVQKLTSEWLIFAAIFSNAPAIVSDIVLGSFSDKYGRKLFVIISLLGTFLKTVLTAVAMSTGTSLTYIYLFMAIEGVTGGWCLVLSLGYAYMSDLTTIGKSRTFAFALVEISVGFGLVLSGVSAGYLIKDAGFVYSMIVISSLNAFNLVAVLMFLPESLDSSMHQTTRIRDLMKGAFTFYIRDTSKEGKRWKFILLTLSYIALTMSFVGRESVELLYQLNAPFCWDSVKIGWYSSSVYIVRNIIGLSSIKLLKYCLLDNVIVIISGLSSILAYVMEAFAVNDAMLFSVPAIGIFTFLASPVIRSVMSQITPPDQQGALFSGIAVVQSVCTVVNEILTRSIYTATVTSFRGFVFLEFAGCSLLMLGLYICFIIGSKLSK